MAQHQLRTTRREELVDVTHSMRTRLLAGTVLLMLSCTLLVGCGKGWISPIWSDLREKGSPGEVQEVSQVAASAAGRTALAITWRADVGEQRSEMRVWSVPSQATNGLSARAEHDGETGMWTATIEFENNTLFGRYADYEMVDIEGLLFLDLKEGRWAQKEGDEFTAIENWGVYPTPR